MATFLELLQILYKKKKELAVLEQQRSQEYSAAGQAVATKQGEVTLAEQAVQDAAK